jgi:N-acylneuraminate cytidylyltransferase
VRTVAFIPARAGSVSIPGKNVKPIAGRPLIQWVCAAALEAEGVDEVFVATDGEDIGAAAAALGDPRLRVIGRSAETATATASTESALLEFAEAHEFDRIVLIQATSPLLTGADLDGGLALLSDCDSVVSVTRQHRFLWRADGDDVTAQNYDPLTRPRRQDWDGELIENGAFYVTSRDALLASRCRLSGRVRAWEMAPETAAELDEPHDWLYIEALLRQRGVRSAGARPRLLVTDCDGVLTDAGMYYAPDGEALKKFNTRDGMGLRLFREAGGEVALMTGEDSQIAAARAKKLGIDRVYLGCKDKLSTLKTLVAELDIELGEVAFIGDDLNDLEVLQHVGLAACPRDAAPEVRAVASFVCSRRGGEGCVRELVDALLRDR